MSKARALHLSDRQRRILSYVELRAQESTRSVARALKLREHLVQYELDQLSERGIIEGRIPILNPELLGFNEYTLYLSLCTDTRGVRAGILDLIKSLTGISWLSESGGEFQYFLSICAAHVLEISNLLGHISDRYGSVIFDKQFAAIRSFSAFGRKYLCDRSHKFVALEYSASTQRASHVLDEIDWRILSVLSEPSLDSLRSLAKRAQIPVSSFMRRLETLERHKVVVGYAYQLNLRQHGVQIYKLLLYTRGMNSKGRSELYQACAAHPYIITFMETIGPWDFELRLEAPGFENFASISQSLIDQFGFWISKTQLLPLFGFLKSSNFPFSSQLPHRTSAQGRD